LLAISRCFARSIEANPRSSLATLTSCPIATHTARLDVPSPGSFERRLDLLGARSGQVLRVRASAFAKVGCNGGATAQVVNSVTLSNKGSYVSTFQENEFHFAGRGRWVISARLRFGEIC